MVHFIFITLIILTLINTYGTWFKDWTKRGYETGFPPGPKSLQAYTWTFRVFTVFILLSLVILYILTLKSVTK